MAISIGDAILKMGIDKADFDNSMRSMDEYIKSSMQKLKDGLRSGGVAFTALGAAALKMVSNARELNAQLGQTALTIGATTKEMRDLALAITDVTFSLESVIKTFDLLARAGVRDTEQMKASAKAFDALADATGSEAEIVADLLLPAFKLFGEEIPTTSAELDKFTWLTKKTLVDLSDFGTLLTRMAPYMDTLDMSMEDAIATLAALSEQGITGTAATLKLRTAITQAASSGEDLNTILGISQEEIDGFKKQMADATDITDKYAKIANEQYGIMAKVKQKWSEITFQLGSVLTSLEPVFALMTAMGPVMIFLSTQVGINTVAWIANHAALVAHRIAAIASSIATGVLTLSIGALTLALAALLVGLGMVAYGIWRLVEAHKAQVAWQKEMADWTKQNELLQKEYNKALEGEANIYTKLLEARLRDIEQRVAQGKATESEIEWLREHGAETEKWIKQAKEEIVVLQEKGSAYRVAGLEAVNAIQITQGTSQQAMTETAGTAARVIQELADVMKVTLAEVEAYLIKFGGPIEPGMGGGAGTAWTAEQMAIRAKYGGKYVAYPGEAETGYPILTPEERKVMGYQRGGPIIEDTLLYGLRSMRPYAFAHKGEVVTPSMVNEIHVYLDGKEFDTRIIDGISSRIRLQGGMR